MSELVKELIKGLFAETPIFGTGSKPVSTGHESGVAVENKTYTSRALEVYNKLCEAIRMKGYDVIERSRSYLEREYGVGTKGYETGSTIEVEPENIKALIHEYAAKLLKAKTGRTHDELHPEICAMTERMERDLVPALS